MQAPRPHNSIADAYRTIKGQSWTPSRVVGTVDDMDTMLDRFIDRWRRWQDQREDRRRDRWKRRMYRDQRFGIW
jgi:hypothetical protein